MKFSKRNGEPLKGNLFLNSLMMTITYGIILLIAIASVLIFDALGAWSSNRFNYNYTNLTLFSLILYIGISYYASIKINQTAGVTIAGLTGLVDGIAGWHIAKYFKANLGEMEEIFEQKHLEPPFVIAMVIFSLFLGGIGAWIAG